MIAINKVLKRSTSENFGHYKVPVIVELVPGGVIRLRLLRQRESSSVSIMIHDLYWELMRCKQAALRADRRKKRKRRIA
jgi:hypothetical protein